MWGGGNNFQTFVLRHFICRICLICRIPFCPQHSLAGLKVAPGEGDWVLRVQSNSLLLTSGLIGKETLKVGYVLANGLLGKAFGVNYLKLFLH